MTSLLTSAGSIASIIGLFGVPIAFYGIWLAVKSGSAYKSLAESVSTRFAYDFPSSVDNLLAFVKLHSESMSTWEILLDYPGYAAVTRPEAAYEIADIIGKSRTKTSSTINVIYHSEKYRAKLLEGQFNRDGTFSYKHNKRDLMVRFVLFWRRYGIPFDYDPDRESVESYIDRMSWDDFVKINLAIDEKCLGLMDPSIKKEIDQEMPLRIWKVDDKHAFFALHSSDSFSKELSFSTGDSNLVDALGGVFKSFLNMSNHKPH